MKILILGMTLLILGMPANAAPVALMSDGQVTITLTDEPCKLPAVSNLQHRATWVEKGKTYQGCWGISPFNLVMIYSDDRSVAVVPVSLFSRATGV